ncbi:TrkH family potassium uptake protein [Mycoplasmopsis hyopharyngis]|uniref:TrkH family potassium uptake protein n=1 Tax=Mycoplasmopsis hyopharyngis TaxID=29558 RepID=UPI003873AC56
MNNDNKKTREFFKNILFKLKTWKYSISKVKYIFITYLSIIIAASLTLLMPFSYTAGKKISYVDTLFTTISAFSDTGLTTVNTYKTWTIFGQAIIAIMILMGGLGIFALKIFIVNYIFQRKNKLEDLELVSQERATGNYGKTSNLIFASLVFLITLTFLSGFILTFYFYFTTPKSTIWDLRANADPNLYNFESPQGNWSLAFRYGFFHSISAINNAGFDIISSHSLMPYYQNYGLHIIFILLLLIGGMGYPFIYDLILFFRYKILRDKRIKKFKWSLFTKLSLTTYLIVLLSALLLVLPFEIFNNNPNSFFKNQHYGTNADKIWTLIFMCFSTRSAGFSTIELADISKSTILIFTLLMFIGAAPASTGGGIRTTTLAVVVLTIFSKIFGRPSVRVFKRKIDDDATKMSLVVLILSTFLVLINTMILSTSLSTYGGQIDANKYNLLDLIFESASAFGTSGLSTGITPKLNIVSKISLLILMFIGQFGVSSTILVWGKKKNYSYKYEYVSENIAIG